MVPDLIQRSQASIEALKQNIQTKSGQDLFDFIQKDIQELKKSLSDPQSMGVIMAAMNASSWINEKMYEWLGEKKLQTRFLNQLLTMLLRKWVWRY